MVCTIGHNVIACGPPLGVYTRRILPCEECERRHRFIVQWNGVWYGTTLYGSCGDNWQDGYRVRRPFERAWRDRAKAKFRAMWDNAAPRLLYEAYIAADIACELRDGTEAAAAFDRVAAVHAEILAAREGEPQ